MALTLTPRQVEVNQTATGRPYRPNPRPHSGKAKNAVVLPTSRSSLGQTVRRVKAPVSTLPFWGSVLDRLPLRLVGCGGKAG